MRSSEVRNLKLFEMTKKNRILELLVTNFARTLSELPKQPIVQWLNHVNSVCGHFFLWPLMNNKLIGSTLSTKLSFVVNEVDLTCWSTLSSPKCSWQVTFNKIAGVGQIWGWRSISSLVGHSLRLPPVSFSHYLLYVVFGHSDLSIPLVTFFYQWKNYAYLKVVFGVPDLYPL